MPPILPASPDSSPDPRWFFRVAFPLLAAALALRLDRLDLTPFNLDEADLAIRSLQIAAARHFPAQGILTSFGFHNPPLFPYLLAPFFAIAADPRLAMAALAVAGTAAALLAGLAARRLWGDAPATLALLLLAAAPRAVVHSRRLWGHDTIVFWTALCLYAAVRGVQNRRPAWLLLSMSAAAAAQACHLSGILLWIFPLGALPLVERTRRLPLLAAGAGILALVYLPWVLHDGSTNDFAEVRRVLRLVAARTPGPAHPTPVPPAAAWITLLGDGCQSDLLEFDYGRFLRESPPARALVLLGRTFSVLLCLSGVAALAAQALLRRSPGAPWALLLLAAALAPPACFSLLNATTVVPYQLPALVPLALAAACALAALRRALPHRLARIALAGCIAAYPVVGALDVLWERQVAARTTYGDYVTPTLRDKNRLVAHLLDAGGSPPPAISQEERLPGRVDDWVTFLYYAQSQRPEIPADETAPARFVIHENQTILAPGRLEFLEARPRTSFGPLAVYRLDGTDAARWATDTRRTDAAD